MVHVTDMQRQTESLTQPTRASPVKQLSLTFMSRGCVTHLEPERPPAWPHPQPFLPCWCHSTWVSPEVRVSCNNSLLIKVKMDTICLKLLSQTQCLTTSQSFSFWEFWLQMLLLYDHFLSVPSD